MIDFEIEQHNIIKLLGVSQHFEVVNETLSRIDFIKQQLVNNNKTALVLGVSGGVDSTVTSKLAQLAVESLRAEGYNATFTAIRLPYGTQRDEQDALAACEFIKPDSLLTINIKPAVDAMLESIIHANFSFTNEHQEDFILGNIKARQRMIAQYAIAGATNGLVLGTDHAAEALMGFFTKFGDGACDLAPLTGLTKRRVRAIGNYLTAPENLVNKCPTADLEALKPLRPDEDAFGISYQQIDDFLEGKPVAEAVYKVIFKFYQGSMHKRQLPTTPIIE